MELTNLDGALVDFDRARGASSGTCMNLLKRNVKCTQPRLALDKKWSSEKAGHFEIAVFCNLGLSGIAGKFPRSSSSPPRAGLSRWSPGWNQSFRPIIPKREC